MTVLLSILVGLLVGWYAREIMNHLKALRLQATALIKRDMPEPEPKKSSIVELPMTPSQRIVEDQNELIRSLNRES